MSRPILVLLRPALAALAFIALLAACANAQSPESKPTAPPGGAWMDASPVAAWNQQGAAIPRPTDKGGEPLSTGRCAFQVRTPEGPADNAVTAAGWTLVGPLQIFGDTSIVLGASSADGMCRPMGYQGFVFVRGRFAGSLSPVPMDARTDGMMNTVLLVSRDRVVATYQRYTPEDPLCCPSRRTTVTFTVKRSPGGSLVAVDNVSTETVAKQ